MAEHLSHAWTEVTAAGDPHRTWVCTNAGHPGCVATYTEPHVSPATGRPLTIRGEQPDVPVTGL